MPGDWGFVAAHTDRDCLLGKGSPKAKRPPVRRAVFVRNSRRLWDVCPVCFGVEEVGDCMNRVLSSVLDSPDFIVVGSSF